MADPAHILVVDDDPRVRKLLLRYLEGEGFRVSEAEDGEAMRRQLARSPTDLILLDISLPGEDGLSLARSLRSESNVPIVMVTGKGDVVDRVVGLEIGADDYISKPFHLREVLARIRTVLRRCAPNNVDSPEKQTGVKKSEGVQFDGWQLDLTRRELRSPDDQQISLSTGEFDLLAVFVRAPNRPLSRDHLMDLLKGRDWTPFDRTIDSQVARLRKKIEADPAKPEML